MNDTHKSIPNKPAMTESVTAEPETFDEVAFDPHHDAVLRIKTPVTVTLAEKRESLDRILALVPGSMLTFDTHCDQPLQLSVGGHPVATGETVKIGDKFGLRIRTIGVAPSD
ncbi:MAG: FliM/FliN family flagellar motor C-terminal domain-containing protein [Planctomycetota bacterium]